MYTDTVLINTLYAHNNLCIDAVVIHNYTPQLTYPTHTHTHAHTPAQAYTHIHVHTLFVKNLILSFELILKCSQYQSYYTLIDDFF